MLFELNDYENLLNTYENKINNYNIDLDYFNLPKKEINKRSDINLENGFYLGNIFLDIYKPYKNYKVKKVNGYSEQQKMLLRLQELDFIINDLNLYLDVNPDDTSVFEIFKKINRELKELKKEYYSKYEVLELCYDDKSKYSWIKDPWPWNGGFYV